MFAEHERTLEHWTQMFIVRWPLCARLIPMTHRRSPRKYFCQTDSRFGTKNIFSKLSLPMPLEKIIIKVRISSTVLFKSPTTLFYLLSRIGFQADRHWSYHGPWSMGIRSLVMGTRLKILRALTIFLVLFVWPKSLSTSFGKPSQAWTWYHSLKRVDLWIL